MTEHDAITLEVLDAPKRKAAPTRDTDGWEHYAWTVRLTFEGRTLDSPWKTGIGYDPAVPPKAEDVLSSLMLDASSYFNARGFEDWAEDYGYDTDSRKAEALWRTVGEIARQLVSFLGTHWGATDTMDAEDAARELVKRGHVSQAVSAEVDS